MRPLMATSDAGATKGDRVQTFRFTLNVYVPEELFDFQKFASVILTELLYREARGEISGASVLGRIDERRLQIRIELDCDSFNKAHITGLDKVEEIVHAAGARLEVEPPTKSVTDEYPGEDFDTKVEQLAFRNATTERVFA